MATLIIYLLILLYRSFLWLLYIILITFEYHLIVDMLQI